MQKPTLTAPGLSSEAVAYNDGFGLPGDRLAMDDSDSRPGLSSDISSR